MALASRWPSFRNGAYPGGSGKVRGGAAMQSFSCGAAIGAGFRVIGRHPLAVLAWAAVYLIFVLAPALAVVRYVLPDVLAGVQQAAQQAAQHPGLHARPDPAALMAL